MEEIINAFYANHVMSINGQYYFATYNKRLGWYGPLKSETGSWSVKSLAEIPNAGGISWKSYEAFRAWARKAYKNGNLYNLT